VYRFKTYLLPCSIWQVLSNTKKQASLVFNKLQSSTSVNLGEFWHSEEFFANIPNCKLLMFNADDCRIITN
ncbi:hypothetical protein, partial [Prevotella disiens]|uniref:hypothetical protein n=1 Tax=Prevotella disiens TaxID=28130 RepID=UPI001B7F81BC